jgi:hypothetical protein
LKESTSRSGVIMIQSVHESIKSKVEKTENSEESETSIPLTIERLMIQCP